MKMRNAPQSGLKAYLKHLTKLLRCATTPRCMTAPSWPRPSACPKSRSETREVCQMRWREQRWFRLNKWKSNNIKLTQFKLLVICLRSVNMFKMSYLLRFTIFSIFSMWGYWDFSHAYINYTYASLLSVIMLIIVLCFIHRNLIYIECSFGVSSHFGC